VKQEGGKKILKKERGKSRAKLRSNALADAQFTCFTGTKYKA
jgi:hypothetical protein